MAARFDAAARLAEGRPVVDDLIEYVAACRQLGYRHSDLTAHAAQVAEWYSGLDGLDLVALETDAAALRAAAAGTDDVAREQVAAVAALRDGWAGSGGGAAIDFLSRHQRAAESVSASARIAADTLTALRDDLWRAVDAQVVATLDAGAAAQRETWLAASRALTSGAGDRATASELVDREVTPFVDNVIGGRWVAAMRAASEAVAGAYQAAVTRLGGSGPTVFEVPFDLGPRAAEAATPQTVVPQALETTDRAVAPVSAPAPGVSAPVAPAAFTPPLSAPMEPGLGAPAASTPAMPSLPSLGESGGMGSGPSGFGSGLADLLSGLGGLSDGGEFEPEQVDADPAEPDDEEPDDDEALDDEETLDDAEEEAEAGDEDLDDEDEDAAVEEPDVAAEVAPEPEPEPAPTPPPPVEPLAAPPPPPVEAPPERTPCEIAADELPQVGE